MSRSSSQPGARLDTRVVMAPPTGCALVDEAIIIAARREVRNGAAGRMASWSAAPLRRHRWRPAERRGPWDDRCAGPVTTRNRPRAASTMPRRGRTTWPRLRSTETAAGTVRRSRAPAAWLRRNHQRIAQGMHVEGGRVVGALEVRPYRAACAHAAHRGTAAPRHSRGPWRHAGLLLGGIVVADGASRPGSPIGSPGRPRRSPGARIGAEVRQVERAPAAALAHGTATLSCPSAKPLHEAAVPAIRPQQPVPSSSRPRFRAAPAPAPW